METSNAVFKTRGTYGYKKRTTSKPNWPLPPYAVFRCRPTTPWIIPDDVKELEIGSFCEIFHEDLPPQQVSILQNLTSGGHRSSDDSLDANVLNMEQLEMDQYQKNGGIRSKIGMSLSLAAASDTEGSSACTTPSSPTSPGIKMVEVDTQGSGSGSEVVVTKPKPRKMRLSKPRAGGVLQGALPDNFLY